MKLIELTTRNFMPYKGDMSVSFPTDPDRNVMLVFGDNMRGKTSLLNALRWTFYGEAMGRHSREIPLHHLPNKDAALEGDWTMDTCVTFEDDGHAYELRRRATKRALVSVPHRPEDFEVVRMLKKDGMILGDHLVDLELNRFAPKQTSRFFLFDGELLQEYENLLLEGSAQGQLIKDAIEQALGVPALIRGREDAQTIRKQAQKQYTKDLEKMSGFERQAERRASLQNSIDIIEADVLALAASLAATNGERIELDDFIEKAEKVYQAKDRLTAAQKSLKENTERQAELGGERLSHIRDAWRELVRSQLTLKRDQLTDSSQKISEVLIQRGQMQARITHLTNSIRTELCEACGQTLHADKREKAAAELGKLEIEIRSLVVDAQANLTISTQINGLNKMLRPGPAGELLSADRELLRLSVAQTTLDNEIDKLEEIMKGQDAVEMTRKRARRDGLVKEEGRIQQEVNQAKTKLDKAEKDLAMVAKTLENVPAAHGTRSSRVARLSGQLDDVFSRSIDRLRDDLKRRVEALANEAFKKMTTQSKYSGLRINSNYGLTILDERGQDVTVRSAGAEQIVALSLIDGLSRAGTSAGPVVMDTPFGRLDPNHRANILAYLPTTTNQLILLVHDGEVSKTGEMKEIASRIGCAYEITEVNPRHSQVSKVLR